VDVRGETLAESLEGYFTQSEQIETFIRLAASKDRLCGLLLQRLPPREGHDDDANWEHLRILASTLGEKEMLEVEGETLLHRLFHEDDRRMFEPRQVSLQCRCSHAGISAMLLGLGEQELAPVLLERGKVEVTCEFCGREYSYSDVEVRALFAAEHATPDHQTRQ
jgi:molecular chaperone Hsp33